MNPLPHCPLYFGSDTIGQIVQMVTNNGVLIENHRFSFIPYHIDQNTGCCLLDGITSNPPIVHLARVVRKVDNAIHRTNPYRADNMVYFVNTYPLESDLSCGQHYPAFELLGPVVKFIALMVLCYPLHFLLQGIKWLFSHGIL